MSIQNKKYITFLLFKVQSKYSIAHNSKNYKKINKPYVFYHCKNIIETADDNINYIHTGPF